MRDQQAVRERELKAAEGEVKACKARAEETRRAWQERQQVRGSGRQMWWQWLPEVFRKVINLNSL